MKVTTRKGKAVLSLDGELTVARAAELHEALVHSLDKAETVEINLDNATRIDLSCLQLLCSAHRTAANRGKTLTVSDQSLPIYLEARREAGFMYSKKCRYVSTDDCLWVGGDE